MYSTMSDQNGFYDITDTDMGSNDVSNTTDERSSDGIGMNLLVSQERAAGSDLALMKKNNARTTSSFYDSPSKDPVVQRRASDGASQVAHPRGNEDQEEQPEETHQQGNRDDPTESYFANRSTHASNDTPSFDRGNNDPQQKGDMAKTDNVATDPSENQDNKGTREESEFDAIARDTAKTLDKNLDNARAWTKKLLREITVYVKTLEMVRAEYLRIQSLEHKESDRLDQVEPDVQGATSHLLGSQFHGMVDHNPLNAPPYSRGNQDMPNTKRKLSHS